MIARNGHALALLETLEHAGAGAKEHEGRNDRHAHHAHEMAPFVKAVAARLDQGRQKHEFEQLFLAAEPHLLGMLRDALDKNTAKLIYGSVSKDLQPFRLDDLKTHLRDHLPPA